MVACALIIIIFLLFRFTCQNGFTLDGASQSICEEDITEEEGEWSDLTPVCAQNFQGKSSKKLREL